jgi:hypothetical protein
VINVPALPPNDNNVSPLSLGLSDAHHNDSMGDGDSSVESSVVETNVFPESCFNDELKGDGGESDAEGEGYALAKSFRESAVLAQRDRIDDGNVIEDDVADYDNNWTLADAEEGTVCGIEGAPDGWVPPGPPEMWQYRQQVHRGEPHFDSVDNPAKWDKYTFRAKFDGTRNTDGYSGYHEMPCGAQPVPLNDDGKRTFG